MVMFDLIWFVLFRLLGASLGDDKYASGGCINIHILNVRSSSKVVENQWGHQLVLNEEWEKLQRC